MMGSVFEVSNSDVQVEYHEQGNQVAPLPNNSDQGKGVPSGECPKGRTAGSSLDEGRIGDHAASHEIVISSSMSDTSSLGSSGVQEPNSRLHSTANGSREDGKSPDICGVLGRSTLQKAEVDTQQQALTTEADKIVKACRDERDRETSQTPAAYSGSQNLVEIRNSLKSTGSSGQCIERESVHGFPVKCECVGLIRPRLDEIIEEQNNQKGVLQKQEETLKDISGEVSYDMNLDFGITKLTLRSVKIAKQRKATNLQQVNVGSIDFLLRELVGRLPDKTLGNEESMPLSFIKQPRPIRALADEVDGPDLSPTRADPRRFTERSGSEKKTPTKHDQPKHEKKWVQTPTHLGNCISRLFEVPSGSREMSRKPKAHEYTEDMQTTEYETGMHRIDSIAKGQLSTPHSVTGMRLPSNTSDKNSTEPLVNLDQSLLKESHGGPKITQSQNVRINGVADLQMIGDSRQTLNARQSKVEKHDLRKNASVGLQSKNSALSPGRSRSDTPSDSKAKRANPDTKRGSHVISSDTFVKTWNYLEGWINNKNNSKSSAFQQRFLYRKYRPDVIGALITLGIIFAWRSQSNVLTYLMALSTWLAWVYHCLEGLRDDQAVGVWN
jgi:hypothetical protein